MQIYHYVWLTSHPHRSEQWLQDKLDEGFDIHHIDGNHRNNDPNNLVLIECSDHMRLHSGSFNIIRNYKGNKLVRPIKLKKKKRPRLGARHRKRVKLILASDVMSDSDANLLRLFGYK